MAEREDCMRCGGTGYLGADKCPICKGKGYVLVKDVQDADEEWEDEDEEFDDEEESEDEIDDVEESEEEDDEEWE